ncbi:hypothetical protein DC915_RS01875 [Vibrio parahaemolyticus]|nr:hypothetical protein [Vibrio parahaemolyticus]EJG0009722.1 hypothetical protein [Vibrio parahaemolyticus]
MYKIKLPINSYDLASALTSLCGVIDQELAQQEGFDFFIGSLEEINRLRAEKGMSTLLTPLDLELNETCYDNGHLMVPIHLHRSQEIGALIQSAITQASQNIESLYINQFQQMTTRYSWLEIRRVRLQDSFNLAEKPHHDGPLSNIDSTPIEHDEPPATSHASSEPQALKQSSSALRLLLVLPVFVLLAFFIAPHDCIDFVDGFEINALERPLEILRVEVDKLHGVFNEYIAFTWDQIFMRNYE